MRIKFIDPDGHARLRMVSEVCIVPMDMDSCVIRFYGVAEIGYVQLEGLSRSRAMELMDEIYQTEMLDVTGLGTLSGRED